ncbi:MAG: LysR family transcriptional regulator [Erysipelotrichaceae bacterium]|nr:LysR family transcriptional regulator [Erysipelotrichaceae bacterium]
MDLRTLRYFVTVAEELNITKAADKLSMSQPPLSFQMKALEKELETELFIRGKRHLQLTESGRLLYRHAKEILNLAEKTSSEIRSMSNGISGTISIGLVEGSAPNIAASWIAEFMKRYPGISFKIMDGNSDELIEKLRSGLVNLAVITSPCDQTLLNSFKVGQEKMHAFMSSENPLAKIPGNTICLSDLKDQPLIVPSRQAIVDMIYKWFKEIKAEPKIVCKMDNYLDVAALAGKNIGISIFPKTSYIFNPQIITKEITESERIIEYLFVWLKGKPLPSIDETFIDYVKENG